MTNLDSMLKSRDITLSTKVCLVKAMAFSSSHVWMWELGHKESWVSKNWCFLNCGVAEDSCESLGLQGDPTSPFWRRSVLGVHWKDWHWSWNSNTLAPDMKNWFIGKDPDAGKDLGQEEKGMTEDEMVGWHHQLNGHGFGWTLGVGDGQGGLVCCNSWGPKELDMTEWLNWTGSLLELQVLKLKHRSLNCNLYFNRIL